MLRNLINYGIRGIILIIGIILLSGWFKPENIDIQFSRIFGIICILFAAYRILTYYTQQKNEKDEQDDDDISDTGNSN